MDGGFSVTCLVVIFIATFLQKSEEDVFLVFFYVAVSLLHHYLFIGMYSFDMYVSGFMYFGSAVLADVLVLSIIYLLTEKSPLATALIYLSVLSIYLNTFGWWLWEIGMSPELYNGLYAMVYAWVIGTLLYYKVNEEPTHKKVTHVG